MKLPNGYGCVTKLSGKRRKPYAVIVTTGWNDEEKQMRKYIGYFATKKEALECLAQYNSNPDEFAKKPTFKEIYDGWHKDKFYGDYSLDAERNYDKACKHCESFHNKQFNRIKLDELQAVCDTMATYDAAYRIKTLVSQMAEWAILREYATSNYAKGIKIKQEQAHKDKKPFTLKEREKVFAENSRTAKMVQVLIYTGLRLSEFHNIKREDCHLDDQYIYIRKSKTNNGIRQVPIHPKIYDTVKAFYDEGNEYVFSTPSGIHYEKKNWYNVFCPLMKDLGMDHTTHETRHTFATMCGECNLNPIIVKKVIGHSSAESLTEAVYTHPSLDALKAEIFKLP